MTLGPLEYVMVAFEGNRFSGQIITALRDAQEKGIIRVIDLLVIKKDEQGNVMALELSDLSEEEARPFSFLAGGLLSIFEPDDVEATAEQMPNNSAAGLMLIEDTWAIPLKEAPHADRGYLGNSIKGSHLERRCRSQGWRPGGSRTGRVDRGRNRSGSCQVKGERVC